MKNKVAGCLFTLLMAFSIGASHAQQKELRKLRLNVFRTDAATVRLVPADYLPRRGLRSPSPPRRTPPIR